ncbi:uncharacterized protein PgNI_08406 [Pyricularia grisea]|uniref:Uncharacterized protein n=1 Tax=Pyricularia grisea TaxID=148305 RepID=A0A6P8AU98_PYRGI|nr:uncharacterized protein PgNI_08406 [Pyricularia grisea]TLD05798.1 hypothetical protein PgNI_08406 [Pyricularia grisea]
MLRCKVREALKTTNTNLRHSDESRTSAPSARDDDGGSAKMKMADFHAILTIGSENLFEQLAMIHASVYATQQTSIVDMLEELNKLFYDANSHAEDHVK